MTTAWVSAFMGVSFANDAPSPGIQKEKHEGLVHKKID